jgi:hypothetical protein
MDTRFIRRTLTPLAATLAASASIASAGPTLIVERVTTPETGERLAVGFEARAFCLRIVAESVGNTVRIAPPRGCRSVGCRSSHA